MVVIILRPVPFHNFWFNFNRYGNVLLWHPPLCRSKKLVRKGWNIRSVNHLISHGFQAFQSCYRSGAIVAQGSLEVNRYPVNFLLFMWPNAATAALREPKDRVPRVPAESGNQGHLFFCVRSLAAFKLAAARMMSVSTASSTLPPS